MAYGLAKDDGYFSPMREAFARSRDRLEAGLKAEGFAVLPSQGTYFLLLDLKASGIDLDDQTFVQRAVREAGVATIPVSSFYAEDAVTNVVRLCFSKKDETIDAGIRAGAGQGAEAVRLRPVFQLEKGTTQACATPSTVSTGALCG